MKTKKEESAGKARDLILQMSEEELQNIYSLKSILKPGEEDTYKLIQELALRRIELEAQNRELIRVKEKAEAEVSKRSELYDTAPLGYLTLSKTGEIIDINLNAARLLGSERSRLINTKFEKFINAQSIDDFNKLLKEIFVFKGLFKSYHEIRLVTNNKPDVIVSIQGVLSVSGDECFITFADITEKKQVERIMDARLRLLQFAISHTVEELLTATLDELEYLTGSQVGFYHFLEADQLRLSLQAWSTRTSRDFCKAEGKGLHYNVASAGVWVDCVRERKVIIHNDYASIEHKKGMPEGHSVIIREMIVPVFRGDLIVAILGIGNKPTNYTQQDVSIVSNLADLAWDITDRKRAEEELQKADEQLLLATAAGGVGIWTFDVIKNKLSWDERMFELYGLPTENFDSTYETWQKPVHPDDILKCDTEIQMALSGEKEFDTSFRVIWPDESVHYINARANVRRDSDGKALMMIGTNYEITALKLAEETANKTNEALNKVISEKDKLFSIIAHDLRSPFTGLLGLSEVLARKSSELTPEEISKLSKLLNESASNIYKLIDNLLEWAQLQKDTIAFLPKEIQFLEIISKCVDISAQAATLKEIEIIHNIPLGLKIYADEKMLEAVCRNLLSNAVKFSWRGGKITITAKEIENSMLEISVTDNGTGIPEKVLSQLFSIGDKIRKKGTEDEPSTGLGLILCKEFVEKNRGQIWVTSKVNVGSTFHFTVPLAR